MTTNLTLITTIVLTAAISAAGTYYVATNTQTSDKPVVEAEKLPAEPQPTPVAVTDNPQSNKPVEIIVKTEVVEKQTKQHDFIAENKAFQRKPQTHLEVTKSNN